MPDKRRRGRPRKKGAVHEFRITLRLREGEHDQLIEYLYAAPPRGLAQAVIRSMYSGNLQAAAQTLEDIALDDILEMADDLLLDDDDDF